jgi:hypothetical protein
VKFAWILGFARVFGSYGEKSESEGKGVFLYVRKKTLG